MQTKNLEHYEVALTINPLMDPRKKIDNYIKYFNLDSNNHDKSQVPVYIHIPFCSDICSFCVFSRQVADRNKMIISKYVEALKKEIYLYSQTSYVKDMDIGAVFFGGGTPTCLSKEQIEEILEALFTHLSLTKGTEVTMECNISNADEGKIEIMKRCGVTRISTGIQTFQPHYRDMLGMHTTKEDIFKWIDRIGKYNFKELSMDLLYGLPGQNRSEWIKDLKTALELPIGHLSIYKLLVYASTKLYKDISSGRVPNLPDNEEIKGMFLEANKLLLNSGFYMRSNQEYGKIGSDNNFWKLTNDGYGDNLSLGASSFGFINGFSYQNLPIVKEYIELLNHDRLPIKMVSGKITAEQEMERTLMLSCRSGTIDKKKFNTTYGKDIREVFSEEVMELIKQGLLKENETSYFITEDGCYSQGNISVKFMLSTFKNSSKLQKRMALGKHIVPEALKPL